MISKRMHVATSSNDVSVQGNSEHESEDQVSNSEHESEDQVLTQKSDRTRKRGIVYLSTIPKFMNVTKIREIFGQYGDVDRVFLQPEEKKSKKKKPAMHFTEGWIEFEKKKVAKQVASMLNNKQIGGRKRSKFYDFIWNIKYLPRFKWVHLSERLAYERAVRKQRMNAEISQAKREANYYSQNVELSERLLKRKTKINQDGKVGEGTSEIETFRQEDGDRSGDGVLRRQYRQRETDSEIREKKLQKLQSVASGKVEKKKKIAHKKPTGPIEEEKREDFLKSLFGKS